MSFTLRQKRSSVQPLCLCGERSSRIPAFPALLILLLATAWLYAPALGFGLIWDDPLWFGRVVDKPLGDLIRPMPDYHFYRPALVLYVRLFLNQDGTFAAPLAHAAQVGWHLVNVALVFALSRYLGLSDWAALAVSGLVALYPLSHQTVAWAAPAQPLAAALQNGAWLAYFRARRRRRNHAAAGLSLLLFLIALFVQEGTAALAGIPLLIELALYVRRATKKETTRGLGQSAQARRAIPWLVLAYPSIAAGFMALWLVVPRQPGFTSPALSLQAMAYFAQGLVFPLLGRPGGYEPSQQFAPWVLLALAGSAIGGLLAIARRAGRGRQALVGLAWALMGIGPAVTLHYSYVRLGLRLLYHASPGAALLWACALLPPANGSRARHLWRTGGAITLGLIALQSILLLTSFQNLYAAGTAHIAELVKTANAEKTRLLCVNFPDRYAPKRPPYPWGEWWMTLAPGSVDLAAFPASVTGASPEILSRRMPWVDGESRDAGPYLVDLRGEMVTAVELYQLACQVDAVYLSRYHADGTFELQWAGALTGTKAPNCEGITFGQTLCLQEARVERQSNRLSVTLTWLSLSPAQPHDTIFAHVGQPGHPPVAQADGDAWLGMIPLTVLQPGDAILDHRIIPLPEEMPPGQYKIRVGVYNRLTGERLPATTPQGDPLPDDATIVGHLP